MDKSTVRSSQSLPLTSDGCCDGGTTYPTQGRHCCFPSNHIAQVMQIVHSLRSHRKLCDVVLRVEDREIFAHRAILAAVSPYFMAMFTGEMVESTRQEVTIRDVSYRILSQIVEFVYTAQLLVTVDTVQDMLAAASILQVSAAQDICCEFMREHLEPSNCLGIRSFATSHGCWQLTESVDQFARTHFVEVVQCDEFLSYPIELLLPFLSHDELNVTCEEDVFCAALRWLQHDELDSRIETVCVKDSGNASTGTTSPSASIAAIAASEGPTTDGSILGNSLVQQRDCGREKHVVDVMKCVRLATLSRTFLLEHADTASILRASLHCRDLLDSAKRFHLMPEGHARRQMRTQCPQTRPRKATIGRVYAVGGKESSELISRTIEIYDYRTNSWCRGPKLTHRRQQLGVAYMDGRLYIVGGSDGFNRLNTVEAYDPLTNKWKLLASLGTARSGVGVGVLRHALYAVGGYDGHTCLGSVERYDLELDSWSFVAPMNTRRSFPGVAALNDRLLVVGGNDGTSFLAVAECFEPHLNRWINIASLNKLRAGVGVASLHGLLYVVGGNDGTSRLDSVECYNPELGQWEVVCPMTTARDGACLAAMGNHLIALGGINGPAYLNSAEIYDPHSNKWQPVASMEVCRVAGGIALVPPLNCARQEHNSPSKSLSASSSKNSNTQSTTH